MYPTIALASSSPRRQELLRQLGVHFELVTPDIDESILTAENAATYVNRLALSKAQTGMQLLAGRLPVLGADTSVVIDDCILGKPEHEADFLQMMQRLSGRHHQVMTAVALVTPTQQWQQLVTTKVWFRDISKQEIDRKSVV